MIAAGAARRRLRTGVFIDYRFRRHDGLLTVERAFALFLFALGPHVSRLTLIGRLDPAPEPYPYRVPGDVQLAELPFYSGLDRPVRALASLPAAARRLWRAAGEVDVLWALGPNPGSVVAAVVGLLRRRRVVLGVRQDLPAYTRRRHPGRRPLIAAAVVLEAIFRLLARRCPVVVVGGDLASRYRHARAVHVLYVSLVSDTDIAGPRPQDGPFGGRILSVGRLDAEKNPLLLADVLAELAPDDTRWRMDVYGDGPLAPELSARLEEHSVGDRSRLHGYVAADAGLAAAYADCDVLLHVSWTEGMPQVLLEAFAAGIPVVATAVGGVPDLAAGAALLVAPGDARAAADALRRVAGDPALRARLTAAGTEVARRHTMEAEAERLAAFLAGAPR